MTTVIITRDHLDEVQPGDRLVALDDVTFGTTRVFTGTMRRVGPGQARGIPYSVVGSHIEGHLYPDTMVEREIVVERDEPEPEPTPAPTRPRRPVTRTIDGLRLVSDGKGAWHTEDGAYEVRKGYDGLTFCEGPHPVRITPGLAQAARQHSTRDWAAPILTALHYRKRGYLCPGEVEHENPEAWQVWDLAGGSNVSPFEESRYDSFTEAARDLADYLQKKG